MIVSQLVRLVQDLPASDRAKTVLLASRFVFYSRSTDRPLQERRVLIFPVSADRQLNDVDLKKPTSFAALAYHRKKMPML